MAIIGTIVIPTLGALFLFALPFLDRSQDRALGSRKGIAVALFGLLGGAGGLTVVAMAQDAADEEFQKRVAVQEEHTRIALALAERSGVDTYGMIPLYRGWQLFEDKGCLNCHAVKGRSEPKEKKGPALDEFLSRARFRRFLENPDAPEFYGGTPLEGEMPGFAELGDEQLTALVELAVSQTGLDYDPPVDTILVDKGKALFDGGECSNCHTLDGTALDAPTLKGYGSADWLSGFIRNPGEPEYFGERNHMPEGDDLTDRELDYLIEYLHDLRDHAQP
jgi:ubiquinol-cytochrome c reductase cytochrome b subunit